MKVESHMVGTLRCGVRRTAQLAVPTFAFTLVELLVVISILGLLAALAVPALKNLGKSNINISASRQLLDDVGRARQLAMANRTTVYMVFVPTNFWGQLLPSEQQLLATTNLLDKQLTSYIFVSNGQVGDQPGRHNWHYLSPWRSLPDGTFIAAEKFSEPPNLSYGITNRVTQEVFNIFGFQTNQTIHFPTETNSPHILPYIAFNYLGQLASGQNEYIPLARGSVSYGIDPASKMPQLTAVNPSDITENPPGNSTGSSFNIIQIDWLTGRATLKFQKVQ